MNTRRILAFMAIAGALLATTLMAQPAGDGPRGPRGPRGPQDRPQFQERDQERPGPGRPMGPPPIVAALDANRDGELSSDEIDNAAKALRSLDTNGDGKLTRDELRPQGPQGRGPRDDVRGQGGPRGPRGDFREEDRRGGERGAAVRERGPQDRPGRAQRDGYGDDRRERRDR